MSEKVWYGFCTGFIPLGTENHRQQQILASLATVAMVTASKWSMVTSSRVLIGLHLQRNTFYESTVCSDRIDPSMSRTRKIAVARRVALHPVFQGDGLHEKICIAIFWKKRVQTNILIYDTSNQPEIGSRLHHSAYSVIFRGPDVHYDVICYKVEEEIFKS